MKRFLIAILPPHLQQNTHMEAMEDGVELHTPPTRLPPPLRDTLVSGEASVPFSCHLLHMMIILIVLLGNYQKCICESESFRSEIVKQLCKFPHIFFLPLQPTYGSHRQRTVKDWVAAGQPADHPADTDAQHGGVYALITQGPIMVWKLHIFFHILFLKILKLG